MSPQLIRLLTVGLKYLLAITGFALMQTLAIRSLTDIPDQIVIIDALFHAVLYAVLAILIFNTLKFGRFQTLHFIQQALIYLALVVLALLLITSAGYLLHNRFIPAESVGDVFERLLIIHLFLSFLVLLQILMYARLKLTYELTEQTNTEDPIETPNAEVKTAPANVLESIAVKSGQKIHVIALADIIYLQADGDYVQIITENGKYLKEQTLKYFEENLPQTLFVRIHRSYMVHVQAIARIELYDKQHQQLSLKNGVKLKISQSGYKTLRSRLSL